VRPERLRAYTTSSAVTVFLIEMASRQRENQHWPQQLNPTSWRAQCM
jgi:hypothetical protein